MSDVSTKYKTSPSQNSSLGGLSLVEGQTRFRDLNDLFRRLMADARQESNEVRSLISGATSQAADAKAAAQSAEGTISEIQASVSQIQLDAAGAVSAAEQASQAAAAAVETADSVAETAADAAADALAAVNGMDSLNARVTSLENASTQNATLVQVDGVSMSNTNGILKAIDVIVGEGTASARGQIGRTGVSTGADLDALLADGWYAVGGENVSGLPDEITSGIVRVSTGYAADCYTQTLIAAGEDSRLFIRTTLDGGTTWEDWKEAVFGGSVGSGLHFEDGVLTADFSNVLPEATAEDTGKCLGAEGQWLSVATPEDIQAVYAAVTVVEDAIEALRTELETLGATIAMGPDGETIMITDGTMSVPLYLGATSEEDGRAGLVPPADAGDEDKFLKGDGTYAMPEIYIDDYAGETSGLVPGAEQGEQGYYLKGDGSWDNPTAALEERVETLEERDSLNDGIMDEEVDALFDWTEPEEVEEEEEQNGGD